MLRLEEYLDWSLSRDMRDKKVHCQVLTVHQLVHNLPNASRHPVTIQIGIVLQREEKQNRFTITAISNYCQFDLLSLSDKKKTAYFVEESSIGDDHRPLTDSSNTVSPTASCIFAMDSTCPANNRFFVLTPNSSSYTNYVTKLSF